MPKPRKTRTPAARRPKKSKASDRIVRLSIGAGDPLQPGGVAEYLPPVGDQRRAGQPVLSKADTRKADRGVALKAAQARWSNRQKGK